MKSKIIVLLAFFLGISVNHLRAESGADPASENPLVRNMLKAVQQVKAGGQAKFESAAEGGDAVAQYQLGIYLLTTGQTNTAVDWLIKSAKQQNTDAMVWLGGAYVKGMMVQKIITNGLAWLESASQKDADVTAWLALLYVDGSLGTNDPAKAVDLLEKASARGSAVSEYVLANCYIGGTFFDKDEAAGSIWLRKAADDGLDIAEFSLGMACLNGTLGQEENHTAALSWFRKAADQNFLRAQFLLGAGYQTGDGVEQNMSEAVKWYRRAADLGFSPAEVRLADCYNPAHAEDFKRTWLKSHPELVKKTGDDGNEIPQDKQLEQVGAEHSELELRGVEAVDAAEAAKWYAKAAEAGNADGQVQLAKLYLNGNGVDEDPDKARGWLDKAIAQGNPDAANLKDGIALMNKARSGDRAAQLEIGESYEPENLVIADSYGHEPDGKKAVYWLTKAAEQGDSDAANELGDLYKQGMEGCFQDFTAAVKWFRKAAEAGNSEAQFSLAKLCKSGDGTPQNYVEAYKWANLSATEFDAAKELRDELVKMMTPEQIADGQKQSADFKPEKTDDSKTTEKS